MCRLARPVRISAAALGGLIAAGVLARPAPLLAVALLALALAVRRPTVAALAAGLVTGWSGEPPPPPRAGSPITLVGRLQGDWRQTPDGWLATVRGERYRQGRRVALWRQRVTLLVPGKPRPPAGSRLRLRGVPTRAAALANRPPLATGRWRIWLKSRRLLEVSPAGPAKLAGRLARGARVRIERALGAAAGRPGASLARALVLGDASRLPPAWRRGLRAAGLAHLVALSGLHVGLLAACCLAAGARLPRGGGALLAVTAAGGFLLLAGARPALVRATLMGVAAAAALGLGRRPHGLSLLAVLAAGLALADPLLLDDLGFRLTCSATAGILWLMPRFEERWRALAPGLRRSLAVTAAAQIGSLSFALPAFRLLTPLAAAWNLLAVPWTALALAASLVWAALALICPPAAAAAAPALDPLAWPFAAVAALSPRLTRPFPLSLPGWGAVLLAAGLAAVLLRPARRWPLLAAAGLLVALDGGPPASPELRLLDVGQGEAVLLRDGPAAVLVDGGGWRRGDIGGRVVVPALAAAGVRRLDAVVLSHPDVDHCGGLLDLLSYLPVAELWTAPGWRAGGCARELLSAPGPRLRPLWAGEHVTVGRWRLMTLHPGPGERGRGNDRSLALLAEAPGMRALLTGDLEAAGERRLLDRWPAAALRADVLKVAHHGSRSSTGAALLAAVRPRLALVSCGRRNRYGHPSAAVLARLERAGVRVLRTDRSGAIVVRAGPGGGWRLATPAAPRLD